MEHHQFRRKRNKNMKENLNKEVILWGCWNAKTIIFRKWGIFLPQYIEIKIISNLNL